MTKRVGVWRTMFCAWIVALVCMGCGDTQLKGEGGFTVDTLEGNYSVPNDCIVRFDGVVGTLDGCVLDGGEWDRPEVTVSTGQVIIGENEITAEGTGSYRLVDQLGSECVSPDVEVSVTLEGRLTKSMGRVVDGPFSALAGTWSGTISVTETVGTFELLPGAPSYCPTGEEPDSLTTSTTISASVDGSQIDVESSEGSFTVLSDGESVTVDGFRAVKQ